MSISDRKEREKEKRRNDIIDAAEAVFFSSDLKDHTMDDIAVKAELSKATIYLYFKNREELLLAIVLRAMSVLNTMMVEAAARYDSGIEKLYSIARAFYEFYQKFPDYFEALFFHGQYKMQIEPHCLENDESFKLSNRMLEFAVAVIKGGIADGSLRPDIDPYKTALSLEGLVTGLIRVVSLEEDYMLKHFKIGLEELIDYSFELIGHSLKSRSGKAPECTKGGRSRAKRKP